MICFIYIKFIYIISHSNVQWPCIAIKRTRAMTHRCMEVDSEQLKLFDAPHPEWALLKLHCADKITQNSVFGDPGASEKAPVGFSWDDNVCFLEIAQVQTCL